MTPDEEHSIICHLDKLLEERSMSLVDLSHHVGISVANLSILKNNRARAVRFTTLTALCRVLDCTPGDIFTYKDEGKDS
ncbi:helix-turn-helix transcriptional regulator [Rothia sp. SD9660Na]|uniref:helix-turn-helix domain-containing protein n=1 Tax=Rothia sp. SD9660Na TaxID=3047030 RepID=UPI0024B8E294|nr:helix-turn-helix transcriptional regulator [Rothia sp. SD9660Na]WHS49688.1 helix-turn-helix transcriptional regulator [Rothia sp. SD9660Na]